MTKMDVHSLTKEQIQKAMACKTADELMTLAEGEGYEMTKAEAEAYLAEFADFELDVDSLKKVAGGGYCIIECKSDACPKKCSIIGH